ncbi:MAG: 4Fe-4S dicluster domain-containing protein [Bacteroidota bacterium]|nr:4Fe-4S dicluster domain-containing protein [Bacteroidota bacterium]
MSKIDPSFAEEIKKYGAEDFKACFNCGNCTAICQLSEKDASFPRMMVRYGMLGLKNEILKSKEPWLCYSCGDCSETCPRQADPGHYMAALRKYIIARQEPSGITRLLFTSNPFAIVFTLLLAVALGFFLFTLKPGLPVSRWLFTWMPFSVIHDLGMIIFIFTGFMIVSGIFNMTRNLKKGPETSSKKKISAWKAFQCVISEMATMKRYQNCDTEEDSFWKGKPFCLKPWFVHWSIMWGFIGLLFATILDFLFKDPSTSIWWPSRVLGTLTGILLVYGTSLALYYRIVRITKTYSETRLADWTFLGFLWIAGITGFWLELAVTFSAANNLNLVVFTIHTIISMELVLLFAFSKFAHAVYRPLALYYYFHSNESGN